MTRIDRRALFASGAAAALLAASGVSAAPQRGGHLRAALSGATRADDWGIAGGRFMQAAQSTLFEGLTEIAADGTLRGEIARDWVGDAAGQHWTFTLRDTVFHDGRPLAQEDLEHALSGLGQITFEPGTLAITLSAPDANLPYRLADPAYLIKPADPQRRAAGIGSGIYRLRKFDAGRQFIADRVETHWKDGAAGWFDTVEFVHFGDPNVRAQALAEGLVDLADIDALSPAMDTRDFMLLPDAARTTQVAARTIAVPAQIGATYPLDNFRMAERWWAA